MLFLLTICKLRNVVDTDVLERLWMIKPVTKVIDTSDLVKTNEELNTIYN